MVFGSYSLWAQQVVEVFNPEDVNLHELQILEKEYGRKKNIPEVHKKSILLALSYYPELKDIRINFKIKKKKSPLMARPGFLGTVFLQPYKRTYFVIISSETEKFLKHIQFDTLPFNAKVGVVGHELSHISDFTQRGFWGIIRIAFGTLSSKWLDKFEFNTDKKTIDHGLGYQLLSWSNAVRDSSLFKKWTESLQISEEQIIKFEESKRERYMNPKTIISILNEHPLYLKE